MNIHLVAIGIIILILISALHALCLGAEYESRPSMITIARYQEWYAQNVRFFYAIAITIVLYALIA